MGRVGKASRHQQRHQQEQQPRKVKVRAHGERGVDREQGFGWLCGGGKQNNKEYRAVFNSSQLTVSSFQTQNDQGRRGTAKGAGK